MNISFLAASELGYSKQKIHPKKNRLALRGTRDVFEIV